MPFGKGRKEKGRRVDSLTVEEIFGESFLQTAAEREKEGEKKRVKDSEELEKNEKAEKRKTCNF